jgi:hypothetical protein
VTAKSVPTPPGTGATWADALIAFMNHFEASPWLYLLLIAFVAICAFAVARLATYLLPRDLAKMMDHFRTGQNEAKKPELLELMEKDGKDG